MALEQLMRVVFVRHGLAWSNLTGLDGVVGQPSELVPEGRSQAEAAAHYLAGSIVADRIHSSPYLRARQTAEILGEVLGLEVVVDDRLAEIGMGEWDGQPVREVVRLQSAVPAEDRPTFRPPGGENWQDVGTRVGGFVEQSRRDGIREVLAVTHDHPIRMGVGALTRKPLETWEDMLVPNASITQLDWRDGQWELHPALAGFVPAPSA